MWKPFFFDGNMWFDVVDSPAKFKDLLAAYDGDLASILDRARHKQRARTGEMPNFGFRNEHYGTQTLGEWLRENGIDLAAHGIVVK